MPSKTILITGAAQRIGASMARYLHAQDMAIVIHYNNSATEALSLVEELNNRRLNSAIAVQGDLLNMQAIANIVEQAYQFKNRLDVLINNASSFYPSSVNETTEEQWEELIGANMKAPFFLAKRAQPYLEEAKGCIISITDIHAQRPLKNHAVYSASKSGLDMITKTLAKELGPNIRVNAVAPGAILWPEEMSEENSREILSKTILKQQGNPDDIAKAVRFLILEADYITGQVLTIDGGRILYS